MTTQSQQAEVDPFKAFADFEKSAEAGEILKSGFASDVTPPKEAKGEAPVVEKPVKEEKPVAEVEDDGGEEHDPDDEKPVVEEKPVVAEERERPKVTRRERIGQLTREKHDALRQVQERDARIAELERTGGGRRQDTPREEQQEQPRQEKRYAELPGKPDPKDTKKYEFAELDPSFNEDMQRWTAKQVLHEERLSQDETRQAEAARTRDAELHTKWDGTILKGAQNHDDFEEKVLNPQGKWKLSKDLWELAVESDVGDKVLYHLASNPAESARIFGLSVSKQGAEFAKLETRFSQPPPNEESEGRQETAPKTVQGTSAPAPIKQAKGSGGKSKPDGSTQNFAEFEATVAAQESARK